MVDYTDFVPIVWKFIQNNGAQIRSLIKVLKSDFVVVNLTMVLLLLLLFLLLLFYYNL